jgi:signal transduction histidine kinase
MTSYLQLLSEISQIIASKIEDVAEIEDKLNILKKIILGQEKLISDISKLNRSNQLAFLGSLHDGPLQTIPQYLMRFEDAILNVGASKDVVKLSSTLTSDINQELAGIREMIQKSPNFQQTSTVDDFLTLMRQLIRQEFLGLEIITEFSINDKYWEDNIGMIFQEVIVHFFRETIINAQKHGKATKIKLLIKSHEKILHLVTVDNGIGFQGPVPNRYLSYYELQSYVEFGIGLQLLQVSLRSYGGQIVIEPTASELGGAAVEASIPPQSGDI